MGITETWLDNAFNNNSVSFKGYEMERVGRHERNIPIDKDSALGTMIYISDKLSYIRRDDLESQNIESIWIELTPKNHPSHLICFVYGSPKTCSPSGLIFSRNN